MKYRKTALVEAEQFLPAEGKIPAGVIADGLSDPRKSPSQWVLDTLEGRHSLRPGDYICTGPAGERWNVERSIFEATYEPVTTPARAEAQDEGAAGDIGAAIQRVKAVADEGIVVEAYGDFPRPFHTFKGDLRALLARDHPSPTPAADADRARIAAEALERVRDDLYFDGLDAESQYAVEQALAALKSEGK